MGDSIVVFGHNDPVGPAGGGTAFSKWFKAEHPHVEHGTLTTVSFERDDLTDDEKAAVVKAVTETDRFWNDHGKDAQKAPRIGHHVAIDGKGGAYTVHSHASWQKDRASVKAVSFEDALKAIQAALQLPK